MKTCEKWCDIENYQGYYQISSFGRVRSINRYITRIDGRVCFIPSRILKPFQGKTCNYLCVQLCKDNVTEKFMIHRLVAKAFLGLKDKSTLEVNHINGNRHDNTVDNLELVTHQQNINHSISHFLKNDYGEKSTNSKLSNNQAEEIRQKWFDGVKQVDLANEYNVSKQTICKIVHYKAYFK